MTDKPAPAKPFNFGHLHFTKLADEPQELRLIDPTNDEPTSVFFMVRGFEGATFRAMGRKEGNANRKREFEAQRKGKDGAPRMLEDDEAVAVRLTLSVLAGWRTEVNGKSEPVIYMPEETPLEFNEANASWFLREFPNIRALIDEFAGEVKNFTRG